MEKCSRRIATIATTKPDTDEESIINGAERYGHVRGALKRDCDALVVCDLFENVLLITSPSNLRLTVLYKTV